jgi:hypothetical protein
VFFEIGLDVAEVRVHLCQAKGKLHRIKDGTRIRA